MMTTSPEEATGVCPTATNLTGIMVALADTDAVITLVSTNIDLLIS